MNNFSDMAFAYFLTPLNSTSHWTVCIERKQGKIFTLLLFGIRLSLFYRWWQSYPRSFDVRFVPTDRN